MILVSDSGLNSGGFWWAELMRIDGALTMSILTHNSAGGFWSILKQAQWTQAQNWL